MHGDQDEPPAPHGPSRGLQIDIVHAEHGVDEDLIDRAVAAVIEGEASAIDYLGVILADHSTVRQLNRDYLDHDYRTDVISFPLHERAEDSDDGTVAGEVYVDLDTAAERAPEFGVPFDEEVTRYVVHGVLHLIGYSDQSEAERRTMHEVQEKYIDAIFGDDP